jgi:hypothetical protein
MSSALRRWERLVPIKTVTKTTMNFVETEVVTIRNQLCVVQVADKEKLNPATIDWSLEYIMVHSSVPVLIGEYVEFSGMDYKVINRGAWRGYGFDDVIAEETKRPLLVETVVP